MQRTQLCVRAAIQLSETAQKAALSSSAALQQSLQFGENKRPEPTPTVTNRVQGAYDKTKETMKEGFEAVKEKVDHAKDSMLNNISANHKPSYRENVKEGVVKTKDWMKTGADAAKDSVDKSADRLTSEHGGVSDRLEHAYDKAKENVKQSAGGIKDKANEKAGKTGETVRDATKWFADVTADAVNKTGRRLSEMNDKAMESLREKQESLAANAPEDWQTRDWDEKARLVADDVAAIAKDDPVYAAKLEREQELHRMTSQPQSSTATADPKWEEKSRLAADDVASTAKDEPFAAKLKQDQVLQQWAEEQMKPIEDVKQHVEKLTPEEYDIELEKQDQRPDHEHSTIHPRQFKK